MGISTFGVTHQDVSSRFERGALATEDQSRITLWITEGAGRVGAVIYELGVEPSDVTSEEPLWQYGRAYILNYCCALWANYATRQDTDYAKSCRDECVRILGEIKSHAVGVRGEEFDAANNLGTFRGGRGRGSARRGPGGSRWSSKTRM